MASLSGILHRPISAAVAVAVVSSDRSDWFTHPKLPLPNANSPSSLPAPSAPLFTRVSISNLLPCKPFADANWPVPNFAPRPDTLFSSFSSSIASHHAFLTPYQYARLAKPPKDAEVTPSTHSSSSDVLYRWHLPDVRVYRASEKSSCLAAKSQTLVVLLGWLGAKQKHLKRYAEWYTSRGFNAVTFTFPMSDIISYKVGGKTEQILELLASHLAGWVAEESGKNLVFHTFSNTGWLTYGVVLEKFQKEDPSVMERIKGCIVDSAPVAAPDPQVWASGFSAAFLKKQSIATKGSLSSGVSGMGVTDPGTEPKPAMAEVALLAVLEKCFDVVLNLPAINRRLSDVLDLLSSEQPKCPQLYIYSSADRVIPARSVESFIEQQRRAGHEVRACDFMNSPHVDHFRNHPDLYTSQLTTFLEDCVLTCCKDSSL